MKEKHKLKGNCEMCSILRLLLNKTKILKSLFRNTRLEIFVFIIKYIKVRLLWHQNRDHPRIHYQ